MHVYRSWAGSSLKVGAEQLIDNEAVNGLWVWAMGR